MASAVTDLEAGLQAMLNLKPPGVSGSRITSLTSLCVANIQSESVLIQKIYTHFKKAPGTHKLGVLYVVDSVTRKWLEQAKSQGQPINSSAQDGTYAAGVHRVTELMPVLMNDILQTAPEDQKASEHLALQVLRWPVPQYPISPPRVRLRVTIGFNAEKIKKLLDIWEKGQTFPASMIESFKEKVNAPSPPSTFLRPPMSRSLGFRDNLAWLDVNCSPNIICAESTTPPGSPPPGLLASLQNQNKPAAPNGSSILEALANIARQNTTTGPGTQSIPAPAAPYSMPPAIASPINPGLPQPVASSISHIQPQSHQSYPPTSQPVNVPSLPFSLTQMLGQNAPQAAVPSASNPHNPYAAAAPAPGSAGLDPNVQQQIMLIKALADQGVPFDKIPALIQSMTGGTAPGGYPAAQPPAPLPAAQGTFPGGQQPWGPGSALPDPMRDQNYQDGVRSPLDIVADPGRGHQTEAGALRATPLEVDVIVLTMVVVTHPRVVALMIEIAVEATTIANVVRRDVMDKWVEFDPTLPAGHIKVLSRTLFVGGVTCSEAELRSIFSRYGTVQTCIVNKDKRHAFVKMLTRKDAVHAKEAMEDARGLEFPLRTRWGVGFGPRDCSDYSTGVSVIPIHKLTDADRKWMLTAPFGGSGGRAIDAGICVEEPDIEIGAGVSSKAISRRMQTDKGGSNGPKSTRQRDDETSSNRGGSGGWRRRDDENSPIQGVEHRGNENGLQQSMPAFPFGIGTLPNGMPNFPAGFRFPDPNTAGRG
ncbi:Rpb7-binding protein seb1 [Cladobotryum mycophilum]|uniref:Rpb7-binding protein seb1 n=1 Tax=Cladobotryum mycophilum TaxID=491253 RepID=A0ABR0T1F9_9HYPO